LRRAALALVLTGCGGFLPFLGGDDDDPAPTAPVVGDAANEATLDEASSSFDAATEPDATPLFWRCTTTTPSAPTSEMACNGERLGSCNSPEEPPIEQPCTTLGESVAHCPQNCQKSAPDSGVYSFTLTVCNCQP
jgi:hypothetical protein